MVLIVGVVGGGIALVGWVVGQARPNVAVGPVVPRPPAAAPDLRITAPPGLGSVPTALPSPPTNPSAGSTAGGTATPADAVTGWAQRNAPALGMSWRALRAYGRAQVAIRRAQPSCRISWTTLAGVGWIESQHGTLRGSAIDADGVVRPRIVGPALDGTGGFALVRSTDGGRLDGDTVYDHGVGPMQFLPETWRRYGRGDPSDIDAAALGAARLLCARSTLGTGASWTAAVLSYNRSTSYVADVWTAAQWYAAGGD